MQTNTEHQREQIPKQILMDDRVQQALFTAYKYAFNLSGHYNYKIEDEILITWPEWSETGVITRIGCPEKDLRRCFDVPGLANRRGSFSFCPEVA